MVINSGEEIDGKFQEKELQKRNQTEFRVEKVMKRKDNNLFVKRRGYDNSFDSWIDKKDVVQLSSQSPGKMIKYFPKQRHPFDGDINVKLDLDRSDLAARLDLVRLKAEKEKQANKKLVLLIQISRLMQQIMMSSKKKLCMKKWLLRITSLILVNLF